MTIGLKYKHQFTHYGRILRSTLTTANSHVIKCSLFFSAIGGKICIWKGFLVVQHNVAISNNGASVLGCHEAIKLSMHLKRFGWPERSRTENISRRAGKVDYSTPLCVCTQCLWALPGLITGGRGRGRGRDRGRATGAGQAAHRPDQLRLPGALGAPAALPQVTRSAAVGLAFLGFCFCSSSAATSVPRLSLVLPVLSC